MGTTSRFLAVVSVLEGRGFPKRAKHKLIAEAKFDGELLATDPVGHTEQPNINQELAWELDRKSLQQHRLQRSSIKIQVYAYDVQTTMREAVGYVVMDLRSAANKQVSKWYHLLHSKYHKMKPELRLALYLDENATGQEPLPSSNSNTLTEPTGKDGYDIKSLVPVLNEEDGYYQIGPKNSCWEQFVLSVTIAHANNLTQLIPSKTSLPGHASGFFFYYSLLGNDVTNEIFHDIVNPNFPAERASVKIRSSVEALRTFLSHQPGLQIHLCCGDQSLGNCDIPLGSLLKSESTEIYMRPVTIEGTFQMLPASQPKISATVLPSSMSPCVGVAVVLRKEDMAVRSPGRDPTGHSALITGASPDIKGHAESPKRKEKEKDNHMPKEKEAKAQLPDDVDHYSDDTFEEASDHTDKANNVKGDVRQIDSKGDGTNLNSAQKAIESSPALRSPPLYKENHKGSSNAMTVSQQVHHFTFSIDLRSIKDNHSTNTINIYLRYVYPFFGSAAPILTHPPIEIRKGSEVLLPQSFCAFDFACTVQQIQDTLIRVPLVVEVFHRDKPRSQDILIGTAKLPLSDIISSDKSRILTASGATGWRQECSNRVAVTSADGKMDKCAEISLVLSLEDWGSITPPQNGSESDVVKVQPTREVPQATVVQAPHVGFSQSGNADANAEYQAALELEMWKEEQEKEFEKKMKLKESNYMKALAEEWKKRDTEREVLTQKKLTEYKQMEDQLRKTLTDLEKREKKLAVNEQEVTKLRLELQREHDRKLHEMKEASRRMQEDCNHQVALQNMKLKEVEDIMNRYKAEVLESERKYKCLEKEFSSFKEKQSNTPEVRLQSEINLLTLEKIELERKLDAAGKSKSHYKQQWGKALKEIARLKQKEQEVAKAYLQRQQQELEHMRLRYLAAEEKEVATKESRELEDIKNQINKLKQMEEERLRNTSDSNHLPLVKDANGKPLNMDLDASVDEHITRLVEERDTLLRTGVYTTQDKIIAELDRQIREAIGSRSS